MTGLVEHLEAHLGPIEAGWSSDADGDAVPFQVARFAHGPVAGTRVFSTLGLSDYPLPSRASDKLIRHELVMLAREVFGERNIPGLLQQVGLEALRKSSPYLRGDVIGPRGPLFNGSEMRALYVAMPVYFPDSFAVFEPPDGEPIVMGWLVPILEREAAYVRAKGWEAFEDVLARDKPDVSDFGRPSISLSD